MGITHTWTTVGSLSEESGTQGLNPRAAFPMDELQPLSCTGRGPDWDNPFVLMSSTPATIATD
jgi:hypothetical protein